MVCFLYLVYFIRGKTSSSTYSLVCAKFFCLRCYEGHEHRRKPSFQPIRYYCRPTSFNESRYGPTDAVTVPQPFFDSPLACEQSVSCKSFTLPILNPILRWTTSDPACWSTPCTQQFSPVFLSPCRSCASGSSGCVLWTHRSPSPGLCPSPPPGPKPCPRPGRGPLEAPKHSGVGSNNT